LYVPFDRWPQASFTVSPAQTVQLCPVLISVPVHFALQPISGLVPEVVAGEVCEVVREAAVDDSILEVVLEDFVVETGSDVVVGVGVDVGGDVVTVPNVVGVL
jgi:hypothetical protein